MLRLVYSSVSAVAGLLLLWMALFGQPDLYLSRLGDELTGLAGNSGRAWTVAVRNWLDGVDTSADASAAQQSLPKRLLPFGTNARAASAEAPEPTSSVAQLAGTPETLASSTRNASETPDLPDEHAPPAPALTSAKAPPAESPASSREFRPPQRSVTAVRRREGPARARFWWQAFTNPTVAAPPAHGPYPRDAVTYGLAGGGG